MASVDRGHRGHVDIGTWRKHDSSSSNTSDQQSSHGDPRSHGTGILPMLPTAGSAIDEVDRVFPRAVASSLASLRSSYGPATHRTRFFSPFSRRRVSFPEPRGPRPLNSSHHGARHISPTTQSPQGPPKWLDHQQTRLSQGPKDGRIRQTTLAESNLKGNTHSHPSGPASQTRSRSSGTGSFDEEEHDDEGGVRLVEDDPVLRQLHKNARDLRYRRTNLSELIDSLRTIRLHAEARRKERNRAELAFLRAANAHVNGSSDLQGLLDAMHKAQYEQDELDQRIDQVIEYLHQAELALDKQERIFFSSAAKPDAVYPESNSESDSDRDSAPRPLNLSLPYELRGISGLRPANIHPALAHFQAAVRELRVTNEYILNLRGKKQSLDKLRADLASVDVDELRQAAYEAVQAEQLSSQTVTALEARFSKEISREDTDFLRSYPNELETSIADRDRAIQRIIHFSSECHRLGLIVSSDDLPPEWRDPSQDQPEDIQLPAAMLPTTKHRMFPLLLANPAALLASEPTTPQTALTRALALPRAHPHRQKLINQSAREVNIHNLLTGMEQTARGGRPGPLFEAHLQALVSRQQPWKRGERINRWLLHKLNMSSMEAETFYAISQDYTDVSNRGQWQRSALRLWAQDEAADAARIASNPTTAVSGTEESLEPPELGGRPRSDSHLYTKAGSVGGAQSN